jgi:hypothetical protein
MNGNMLPLLFPEKYAGQEKLTITGTTNPKKYHTANTADEQ